MTTQKPYRNHLLNKFDLRYLRFFITTAEHQSFTKAAQVLCTSQPSLSHQIQRLEEIIGTPLFDRNTRQVELTKAGKVFLDDSRRIIEDIELAVVKAQRAAKNEIRYVKIGIVSGLEITLYAEIIPEFQSNFPDVSITTLCDDEKAIGAAFKNKMIDIAIGLSKTPDENSEHVHFENLFDFDMKVILPAGHPLSRQTVLSLKDLASTALIRPNPEQFPLAQAVFDTVIKQQGIEPKIGLEADGVMPTISAVQAEMGYAIIPEIMVPLLPPSVTACSLTADSRCNFPVNVAIYKDLMGFGIDTILSNLRKRFNAAG